MDKSVTLMVISRSRLAQEKAKLSVALLDLEDGAAESPGTGDG